MESSIAVFLEWWSACELLPTDNLFLNALLRPRARGSRSLSMSGLWTGTSHTFSAFWL